MLPDPFIQLNRLRLRLDPKFGESYNNRGCAYLDKGDLDKALADYDKAIQTAESASGGKVVFKF